MIKYSAIADFPDAKSLLDNIETSKQLTENKETLIISKKASILDVQFQKLLIFIKMKLEG